MTIANNRTKHKTQNIYYDSIISSEKLHTLDNNQLVCATVASGDERKEKRKKKKKE